MSETLRLFFFNFSCVWAGGSPESLTEVQGSLLLVAEGKEHSLPPGCVNIKNSHLRFTMFLKSWRCGFYANEKLSISIQVQQNVWKPIQQCWYIWMLNTCEMLQVKIINEFHWMWDLSIYNFVQVLNTIRRKPWRTNKWWKSVVLF